MALGLVTVQPDAGEQLMPLTHLAGFARLIFGQDVARPIEEDG